jgi:hypothetical protein
VTALVEPFIGPRPFTERETDVFFGRHSELAALVAEVVSTPIVLLYAPSGCGKSSLINAGLIPALRDDGFSVTKVRASAAAASADLSPIAALRAAIERSASASSPEQPSLLVLDQFEEILVGASPADLQSLSELAYGTTNENPLVRLVLSIREEYLARIGALFNKATQATVGRFHLHRLSKAGAVEAFERSLTRVGFSVSEQAAEFFVDQLSPPSRAGRADVGIEPLYLQLLGSQLWSSVEGRDDGERVVSAADVKNLIDFENALEVFFNSTIRRVCASHHIKEKPVRDWIDRELVTSDETRSMVRREPEQTKGLPTDVLDSLVQAALLRTEPRGDDLWLELAHDQIVERVREIDRLWWNRILHARLRDRSTRLDVAITASSADMNRWIVSRASLWSAANVIRETGMQVSQAVVRWLPFGRSRSGEEPDRLALRAYVLTGTLAYTGVSFYRMASARTDTTAVTVIEGLDPGAAKARLRATSLNLGKTGQWLVVANVLATASWLRMLSGLFVRATAAGTRIDRRRSVYVVLLWSADLMLTLLRWTARNGLIATCLDPDVEVERSRMPGRADFVEPRRCTSLEEAATWSHAQPLLLVLDWRSRIDPEAEFERIAEMLNPYRDALRARGAIAAWCCRDDARRPGWRDAITGIGFPARGHRTYYMVERGHVVAWRLIRNYEHGTFAQGGQPAPNASATPTLESQFATILTSLIVENEARPSFWRGIADKVLDAQQRRRPGRARV